MKNTVQSTVAAPTVHVWRAYTTPADIMLWTAASREHDGLVEGWGFDGKRMIFGGFNPIVVLEK